MRGLVAIALALPLTLSGWAQDAPAPEQVAAPVQIEEGHDAVITALDGEVTIKRAEQWEAAALGAQLDVGHELRTDEGRSGLRLRGRGELRLPASSHLRLEAIDEAGLNVTLNLVRGSVWADVEAPETGGVNFNVQTPDLTAGVRGTVFNVSVLEGAGSRISVTEGVVAATSNLLGETAEILAGFSIFCDTDGHLSAPEVIHFDLQREWDEWEQWVLEAPPQMVAGDVISGIMQTTAAEHQLHATMVAEHAAATNLNRQGDFLVALSAAFLAYAEDVRDLPPSEAEHGADGWQALLTDPGMAGWSGPYLPESSTAPVNDGWGHPITYRRQRSPASGNVYGDLISNGPNGIFSDGRTDDLRQIIRLPDAVQAELQSRATD